MSDLTDKANQIAQLAAQTEDAQAKHTEAAAQLAVCAQTHFDARTLLETAYLELRSLIDAGAPAQPVQPVSIPQSEWPVQLDQPA
jgi:hypothetical protein